jgi:hypothetical protein
VPVVEVLRKATGVQKSTVRAATGRIHNCRSGCRQIELRSVAGQSEPVEEPANGEGHRSSACGNNGDILFVFLLTSAGAVRVRYQFAFWRQHSAIIAITLLSSCADCGCGCSSAQTSANVLVSHKLIDFLWHLSANAFLGSAGCSATISAKAWSIQTLTPFSWHFSARARYGSAGCAVTTTSNAPCSQYLVSASMWHYFVRHCAVRVSWLLCTGSSHRLIKERLQTCDIIAATHGHTCLSCR